MGSGAKRGPGRPRGRMYPVRSVEEATESLRKHRREQATELLAAGRRGLELSDLVPRLCTARKMRRLLHELKALQNARGEGGLRGLAFSGHGLASVFILANLGSGLPVEQTLRALDVVPHDAVLGALAERLALSPVEEKALKTLSKKKIAVGAIATLHAERRKWDPLSVPELVEIAVALGVEQPTEDKDLLEENWAAKRKTIEHAVAAVRPILPDPLFITPTTPPSVSKGDIGRLRRRRFHRKTRP